MSPDTILPHDWHFVVLGVSHHQTPIALLEKAVIDGNQMGLALRDLHSRNGIMSGFILSTCNRIEIYAIGDPQSVLESCQQHFANWCLVKNPGLITHVYQHKGQAAMQHLFSVASSIDSMIPGESQILGQVKEAYENARMVRQPHAIFDRIMRKCYSVAKKIRTETDIASHAVSIAYAATKLAEKIFENISESRVLLVGAGEMGELAAKHLMHKGIKELIICNRSFERALDIAASMHATAIPMEKMLAYMTHADIVLVATGAPDVVIYKDQVQSVMHQRLERQLFMIDITLPRNIDPRVDEIDNVYLYNIDDLKNIVSDNLETRKAAAEKALRIIDHDLSMFVTELQKQRQHALIAQIDQHMRSLVKDEIMKSLVQPKSGYDSEELSDQISASIVSKWIQRPADFLRNHGSEEMASIIRKFLGLSETDADGKTHKNRQ